MVVQRLVNRRGLVIDRDPQPGDFRDSSGLRVDPQSQIVSPYRTLVKVQYRSAQGQADRSTRPARKGVPVGLIRLLGKLLETVAAVLMGLARAVVDLVRSPFRSRR
jgi:hypothetical protein